MCFLFYNILLKNQKNIVQGLEMYCLMYKSITKFKPFLATVQALIAVSPLNQNMSADFFFKSTKNLYIKKFIFY